MFGDGSNRRNSAENESDAARPPDPLAMHPYPVSRGEWVMRVVFWGTYDTGKPRVRILLRGLKENGVEVIECHTEVWRGVEDKTQVKGLTGKLRLALHWAFSYPPLVWRYLRLPKHDVVVVGYMGHLDVLVLWCFAKLRGVPIVWDAFLSLYNTVVDDRKMFSRRHPLAVAIYAWEWVACRAADLVLLDTKAHAAYFVERFKLSKPRAQDVLVGVEPELFAPQSTNAHTDLAGTPVTVLFYGQFIPLHGIDTIVDAARLAERENIRWVLIGRGQEEGKIREMLGDHPLPQLRWIPWVKYEELAKWIQEADVCLGIFGDTDKAARVIPNKVFQILSVRKPLITRDSPAIRELLPAHAPGWILVPAADPAALVAAVREMTAQAAPPNNAGYADVLEDIQPNAIGRRAAELLTWVHRERG